MHVLDILMYFISVIVIWYTMDYVKKGDFTKELGSIIGVFIILIYTIIYILIFGVYDLNWIDIIKFIGSKEIPLNVEW